MDVMTIFFIAIGLAMDAFAVSIASGCAIKQLRMKHVFTIAFSFGFFQGIMPIIGWLAGIGFRNFIADIDHWIAFVLLLFIGLKMIYESYQLDGDAKNECALNALRLFLLSIATSIDALAVGLSFSFLNINIVYPALLIGGVTFVLCVIGVLLGERFGHFFEQKIEIIGGLILIFMGFKILFDHLGIHLL